MQGGGNPYGYYDQTGGGGNVAPTTGASGAGAGRGLKGTVNKLGKQAENIAGNLWGHIKVSNSVPDSAMGKLSHGTRLLRQGGFEGVYRDAFGFAPNEKLLKTYAWYLSTSSGAIGGTLYVTNQKFAFCSDRPVSYSPAPGQQASNYYKVIVPLEKVREVAAAVNNKKPTERYIQVVTVDDHEFWYMGFVNYDKGLKNMQEALRTRINPLQGGTAPQSQYPPPPGYPGAPPAYPPASTSTTAAYGQHSYPPNVDSGQSQGWHPRTNSGESSGVPYQAPPPKGNEYLWK